MRMLHGQTRYNIESRFIDELPEELLKKINHAKNHQQAPPSKSFSPAMRSQGATGGFRIGQQVRHAKFGDGIIVQAEGQGGDARLQVNFRQSGLKWLALEYAKLTTI